MRILTLVMLFVMTMFAVQGAQAGFVGPDATGNSGASVKQILDNPVDDMWVTLRGHILKRLGDEKYTFSDGTGQIVVEIDHEDFPPGTPITPTTPVVINGEVDKNFGRAPEIDVDRVTIDGGSSQSTSGFQESPQ